MSQRKDQPAASHAGERVADLVDRSRDPETWLEFADQVRQQWGAAAETLGDAMCQAGTQIKRSAQAADAETVGTLAASAMQTGKRAQAQIAGVIDSLGETIETTGKLAQTQMDMANAALSGLTDAASKASKAGKKRQRRLTKTLDKATRQAGKSWQGLADELTDIMNQGARQARGRSARAADSVSDAIGDTMKDTGKRARDTWEALAGTLTGALDDTGKWTRRRTRKGQRDTRKALGRVMRSLVGARLAVAALPALFSRRSRRQMNARRRANANRSSWAAAFLGAAALGAGVVYFYDSDLGAARRAQLRDRLDHLKVTAADALSRGPADLTNRLRGLAGGMGWQTGAPVPDHVLADRVRSQVGRVTSHPDSIGITAHQGLITLSGPILTHEENRVLSSVHSVPGVTGIENRLETHDQPDGVPGLQGHAAVANRDF